MNKTLIITKEQEFANGTLLVTLSTLATVVSVIGSSLIVATYLFYKDIRTPSRHIIVCISASDLIVSLGNFYMIFGTAPGQPVDINITCIIQSFIVTTAMQWSFMWTMALAVFLNILVVARNPRWAESLLHPYFHLICWLVPLSINLVALCLEKLGTSHDYASSGWCWIKVEIEKQPAFFDYSRRFVGGIFDLPVWWSYTALPDNARTLFSSLSQWETRREKWTEKDNGLYITNKNDAILWMTLDGKLIEIITYVVVFILFMRIKCYLREKIKVLERNDRDLSSPVFVTAKAVQAAKTTDRKLIFIPVVLILLRIWGTVRYILFILNEQKLCNELVLSEKVLMLLQSVGDNVIGAVNCVLFCFLTPKVRNHLKESWRYFVESCCSSSSVPSERTKLLSEAT